MALLGSAVLVLVDCAPPHAPKKLEMEPIGTWKNVPTTTPEDTSDSGVTAPNSGTLSSTTSCSGADFESLDETLRQCEVPMPRASEVPSLKDKLEVRVTTSVPSLPPGGRTDVQVTLRNKTSDPIVLYFTGDPVPRFDVEAVDPRGRRADLPTTKWPGYPKGSKPDAREAKAARVTLEKNGTAKIRITWDAVKTKWAPDRAKTWDGRGFPRVPSGPLPTGKYTLRVVLPLLGDVESGKVTVDVAGS